jgi:hypothetical protein
MNYISSNTTAIAKVLSPRYQIIFCDTCKHPMFCHRTEYIKEFSDMPDIPYHYECLWYDEVKLTGRGDFSSVQDHTNNYDDQGGGGGKTPDHIHLVRKIHAECKCQAFKMSAKSKIKFMDEVSVYDDNDDKREE